MEKWKCPLCGREFSHREQSHYCKKPADINEYILSQDERVQPRLRELHALLREALPQAEECISWSMPTFRKGRNLIHFAAAKKHVGLYPGDEAVAAFAGELEGLEVSRGTIRLPYDRELPAELIGRIARWCFTHYAR